MSYQYAFSRRQQKEIERGRMLHIVIPGPPAGQDLILIEWVASVLDTSLGTHDTRGEQAVIERAQLADVSVVHDCPGGSGVTGVFGRIVPAGKRGDTTIPCVLIHIGRHDVVARARSGKRAHIESRPQWPGVTTEPRKTNAKKQKSNRKAKKS